MMVSPLVDEIAEETSAVKVGKVNVDEEGALAADFGIESIPTLVVIKDGKIVKFRYFDNAYCADSDFAI